MRVYISGALQASQDLESAKALYVAAAKLVTDLGFEAYLPHVRTDPIANAEVTPRDVYRLDLGELHKCDAVIAFLNEPSLGVGAEVTLALHRGMPVLGLHHTSRCVSRFLAGLMEQMNAPLETYEGEAQVRRIAQRFLLQNASVCARAAI